MPSDQCNESKIFLGITTCPCPEILTVAANINTPHKLKMRFAVERQSDNLDNLVLLHSNCHRQVHYLMKLGADMSFLSANSTDRFPQGGL
jgi:5-methylcytosine-specific restriction endonuclease McrA